MNFKKIFSYIFGYVYIPDEVMHIRGKKLLHISDTPLNFFNELESLIKKVKPDYIVHTGDLVDNIKLQVYPYTLARYDKHVKEMMGILEGSGAKGIYIALGNHDNKEVINKYKKDSYIVENCEDIIIEGVEFRVSHYSEDILKSPKQVNLFGHDLCLRSKELGGRKFFNGITTINIIELDSLKFHMLHYPAGTDDSRLGRGKIGL